MEGDRLTFRRVVSVTVLTCLLLQTACATTKTVPIMSDHYGDITEEDRIFVTLRTGEQYELINCTITATHINGIRIVRGRKNKYVSSEGIAIALKDVATIHAESTDATTGSATMKVFAVLGVVALVTLIACVIAAATQ